MPWTNRGANHGGFVSPDDATSVTQAPGSAGAKALWETVSTPSQDAIGPELSAFRFGGAVGGNWPIANEAILVPFHCWGTRTAKVMFYTSTTAAGNLDIGIYSKSFSRIVSFGSTPVVLGFNVLDIADTSLQIANSSYAYMVLACDTVAAQFLRWGWGVNSRNDIAGVVTAAASFPLPATITPDAVCAHDQVPRIGVGLQAVL